jgi:hypothetical protein
MNVIPRCYWQTEPFNPMNVRYPGDDAIRFREAAACSWSVDDAKLSVGW